MSYEWFHHTPSSSAKSPTGGYNLHNIVGILHASNELFDSIKELGKIINWFDHLVIQILQYEPRGQDRPVVPILYYATAKIIFLLSSINTLLCTQKPLLRMTYINPNEIQTPTHAPISHISFLEVVLLQSTLAFNHLDLKWNKQQTTTDCKVFIAKRVRFVRTKHQP